MRKPLILCFIVVSFCRLTAQQLNISEVLVVYIHPDWNKEKRVIYYTIHADPGVSAARDLYNLRSVAELLPAETDDNYRKIRKERFSNINKDSIVYNYFDTESAALNFILSKDWKLFSSASHIVTKYDGIHTNTYSVPKYLFVRPGK